MYEGDDAICDDGDICTVDECVAFDGCVHSPDLALDPDEDGVCSSDNCPLDANADQANEDQDSAGDACDPCPQDPDDGCGDPHNACCFADIEAPICVFGPQSECQAMGGNCLCGKSCGEVNCFTGACCIMSPMGSTCMPGDMLSCIMNPDGFFLAGSSCDSHPCP